MFYWRIFQWVRKFGNRPLIAVYSRNAAATPRHVLPMDIDAEKVLATLDDPSVARALVNHERNALVVNTEGAYFYLDRTTQNLCILSGELPRLKLVFWSHTNSRNIKKQPKPSKSLLWKKGKRTKRRKEKKRQEGRPRGRFAGLVNGCDTHNQMKSLVLYDARTFRKMHKQVNPYTTRLMQAIVSLRHWTPLLPEFDLFDARLGIGTSVDLIGVDRSGDLILMEFKTGYSDYWHTRDGYMHGALAGLANTPCNRACVQVAVSALILQNAYDVPGARMHAYVLRIDDEQIQIIAVPETLWLRSKGLGAAIYADLLKFQQEKKMKNSNDRSAVPPPRRLSGAASPAVVRPVLVNRVTPDLVPVGSGKLGGIGAVTGRPYPVGKRVCHHVEQ